MQAHNAVNLIGRLTRDPEQKYTAQELCIAQFTLAIDGRKKDDPASFIDCTAFGKTAEIIAQHFTKGKPIAVVGSLRQEKWDDKDGNKRSKITVVVEGFSFLPRNSDEQPSAPSAAPEIKRTVVHPAKTTPPAATYAEDEPPF